jgi:hypothetical protein
LFDVRSSSFDLCLKVDRGGEDAFFVSGYNGGVIAVADGVSGYGLWNYKQYDFKRKRSNNKHPNSVTNIIAINIISNLVHQF